MGPSLTLNLCPFAGSTLNSVLKDSPYQDLLLQFLCDRRHTANPLQHSAVTFILCRAFVEALTHHQKQELPEDEQHLLLTQFRELETLLKRGTTSDISEGNAVFKPCQPCVRALFLASSIVFWILKLSMLCLTS